MMDYWGHDDDYTAHDAALDELDGIRAKLEIDLRDNDQEFADLCQFVALCRRFGYNEIADKEELAISDWIDEELEEYLEVQEEARDPYGYRGLRRSDFV